MLINRTHRQFLGKNKSKKEGTKGKTEKSKAHKEGELTKTSVYMRINVEVITIGVSLTASIMWNIYTTNNKRIPWLQPVKVKPVPDPKGQNLRRSRGGGLRLGFDRGVSSSRHSWG